MDLKQAIYGFLFWVLQALFWIWAAAKFVMDWIGRAALPDDAEKAQTLLQQGFVWLFTTPWWVPAILAFCLTVFIGVSAYRGESRRKNKAPVDTGISLRFSGGNETPTPEEGKNIYGWYALQIITQTINTRTQEETRSRMWTIFLVFDKEVNPKRLNISSEGFAMPLHEVKEFRPRHAIIVINADLPAGVLNIKVDQ